MPRGMIAILLPDAADAELAARLARLRRDFRRPGPIWR